MLGCHKALLYSGYAGIWKDNLESGHAYNLLLNNFNLHHYIILDSWQMTHWFLPVGIQLIVHAMTFKSSSCNGMFVQVKQMHLVNRAGNN